MFATTLYKEELNNSHTEPFRSISMQIPWLFVSHCERDCEANKPKTSN